MSLRWPVIQLCVVVIFWCGAPATAQSSASALTPVCRLMFPSLSQSSAVVGERPSGPFVDVVAEIFDRADVLMEPMPYVPWTRAVALTELGRFDGLAIAMQTPEREEDMVFIGPFLVQAWSIFRLGDNLLPVDRPVRVGVESGFARLTPIKQVLETANVDVIELASARLRRMLIEGNIDAILSTDSSMEIWAERENQHLVRVENTQTIVPTYIALMKTSTCADHQGKLQRAIEAWVAGGGREAFLTAYDQTVESENSDNQ